MRARRSLCGQFCLRKVHSLTGFVFLGYFLCIHTRNAGTYGSPVLRLLFLYLPLLFHAVYGLYISYEMSPNLLRYGWVRNGMYLAQRVTGLLLVPFILLHLGAVRLSWDYGESSWYLALWYGGVLVSVFHLANGVFGTAIDWGVAVGPHSQRVLVIVSFAAFFILSAYGVYTLSTF
jgi:succinate dehydrogenase / fumarate reductase, cytochrome b subunit